MVNARLRKSTVKNKIPVFSIGNPGDLTYDYTLLGDDINELKKTFCDPGHELPKKSAWRLAECF